MGRKVEDIVGRRFGKLIVISLESKREVNGGTRWMCKCDCGRTTVVFKGHLTTGNIVSCGCHRELFLKTNGVTHGLSHKISEYTSWVEMRRRCINEDSEQFKHYGAKGINICSQWDSFEVFYGDMGPKPGPEYSIDRHPNKKGNYEPGNCRWATASQQNRNKTNNRGLTYDGKTMILCEWAEYIGVRSGFLILKLKTLSLGEIIQKYKK